MRSLRGRVVLAALGAVALALAITGAVSARPGRAPIAPAMVRPVLGGAAAMAVTYGIGTLVGAVGL